jgi:hypothetical protein
MESAAQHDFLYLPRMLLKKTHLTQLRLRSRHYSSLILYRRDQTPELIRSQKERLVGAVGIQPTTLGSKASALPLSYAPTGKLGHFTPNEASVAPGVW